MSSTLKVEENSDPWWSTYYLPAVALAIRSLPKPPPDTIPFPDPDELPAGKLRGEPDEDFDWRDFTGPPFPVPLAFQARPGPGLLLPDPEEIPAGNLIVVASIQDEDFWENPVPPVVLALRAFSPDDVEELPAGVLFGQPDEDFSGPVPEPVSLTFRAYWPGDLEELPASALHGQPDEDFPGPLPAPVSLAFRAFWPGDLEELPAGRMFGQADEDFLPPWPAPTLLTFQAFGPADAAEAVPVPLQPDEDFWVVGVSSWVQVLLTCPWTGDPLDVPAQPVLDEDFWANPTPPAPWQWYLFPPDDGLEEWLDSGVVDEDFWLGGPTPTVPLTFVPSQADRDEIPAAWLFVPQKARSPGSAQGNLGYTQIEGVVIVEK